MKTNKPIKLPECPKCGPQAYLELDGGGLDDGTSFEGVRFKITVSRGRFKATTPPDAEAYMENFNEKRWLSAAAEEAKDAAEDGDLFCPTCGETQREIASDRAQGRTFAPVWK